MGASPPLLVATPGDGPVTPLRLPHHPTPTGGSSPCDACPLQSERLALRQQVGYWKAMHARACQREAALRQQVAELEAQLCLLRQQHFGRRSEARSHPDQLPADPATTPAADGHPPTTDIHSDTASDPDHRRPRGQQRGHPGHGRRDHSHLPTTEEVVALPADQQCCAQCGQPFADFPGTDDTTILEIDVKAHRRLIRRRRYRPTCTCGVHPGIITPPPPPRLIPKSPFGISIWVTVLLDKYQFYRPTSRLLEDLRSHGLDLSQGGLTEGLKRLAPLFKPLYEALVAHNQRQYLWNADETRWFIFASIEGKVGYEWYLWLFQSAEAVVFVLAAGRAHDVPEEHFAPVSEGIVVVDRFSAYKAMDQVKAGKLILAFCWAHQRRDFIELARSWPEQRSWTSAWLERIGKLYALNERRLELREDSEGFEQCDRDLRAAVDQMAQQAKTELAGTELHPACRRALASLDEHWIGLTVFVEHPEVPMDNNQAERTERGPVVGRKNFYGSGAVWAGQLAAWLFSLVATLRLWEINPRAWLTAYLTACAELGGKAPTEVSSWLPWNQTAEQRAAWQVPQARPGSDTS
jgi:transposase